jgi:hypothetical protein
LARLRFEAWGWARLGLELGIGLVWGPGFGIGLVRGIELWLGSFGVWSLGFGSFGVCSLGRLGFGVWGLGRLGFVVWVVWGLPKPTVGSRAVWLQHKIMVVRRPNAHVHAREA